MVKSSKLEVNSHLLPTITRAYVKRRGPRRKGVNMDVILSPLSLMAASLLALVRPLQLRILFHEYTGLLLRVGR